ncbi:MAG: hypothetical protein ACXIUL_08375 [Wenzhouxiangella sp.]
MTAQVNSQQALPAVDFSIRHLAANELHVIKGMTDSALGLLSAYSPAEIAELQAIRSRLCRLLDAAERLEQALLTAS